MIYNHRYVSLKVLKLLIKKKCPLCIPIEGNKNPHIPAYYTKSPNQKGFEDCDVYYYPTQDQVIDWLEQEHKIFVYAFPLYDWTKNTHPVNVKQWGVSIKHNAIEKGCNNTYSSKQEAIDAGLLFVLNILMKDEVNKS